MRRRVSEGFDLKLIILSGVLVSSVKKTRENNSENNQRNNATVS